MSWTLTRSTPRTTTRRWRRRTRAEDITRVLYPNDTTWEGKRLRIKQQYVLSSASLQDILRSYQAAHGDDLEQLGRLLRHPAQRHPPCPVHPRADPAADEARA